MESADDATPASAEFAGLPEAATRSLATAFDALCLTVLPHRDQWDEYAEPESPSLTSTNKKFGFRFLDLPGELRNRIYAIALSGYNIHIGSIVVSGNDKNAQHCHRGVSINRYTYIRRAFTTEGNLASPGYKLYRYDFTRFQRTLCDVPCHSDEAYEASKTPSSQDEYEDEDDIQPKEDAITHKSCRDNLSLSVRQFRTKFRTASRQKDFGLSLLPLNLLATCRQIYEEACLIPYATNKFSFDNPTDLRDLFSLAFTDEQRSAVRYVHLAVNDCVFHFRSHPLLSALEQRTVAPLTGLKEFRMTLTGNSTRQSKVTIPSPEYRVRFNNKTDRMVAVKVLFAPKIRTLYLQDDKIRYVQEWVHRKPPRQLAWEIEEAFGRNADCVAEFGWVAEKRTSG